jgi:hypothetical protein
MKQTPLAEDSEENTGLRITLIDQIKQQLDVTCKGLTINGNDRIVNLQAQRAPPADGPDILDRENTVLRRCSRVRRLGGFSRVQHGVFSTNRNGAKTRGKPRFADRSVERSAIFTRMIIPLSLKSAA